MKRRILLPVCLLLVSAQQAIPQTTITVGPGDGFDQATIQAAIDAATTGDTIVVYPATYVENIQFNGKSIVLRSADPTDGATVAATIIDGNSNGSVVTFAGTETSNCVLSGFTIQNGSARIGGGIQGNRTLTSICDNRIVNNRTRSEGASEPPYSRPPAYGGGLSGCNGPIRNNYIANNSAYCGFILGGSAYGGGLARCHGLIENNVIVHNSARGMSWIGRGLAEGVGGGLYDCDGTIQNNVISSNSCTFGAGGGLNNCGGPIRNNTIVDNTASGGELIGPIGLPYFVSGCALAGCNGPITNCIIWGNTCGMYASNVLSNCTTPTFSCVQESIGRGIGCFSADPRLADPANDDYHLRPDSPCIDAGGRVAVSDDFEGDLRPFDATPLWVGDGSDYDIGADEFIGAATPSNPPNQPANLSPAHGATGVSPRPTLAASAFVDADAGDIHLASQWQIRQAASPADYSIPSFDSGRTMTELTSTTLPGGTLVHGTACFWRVRYQDSRGAWSPWSNETLFTTRLPIHVDGRVAASGDGTSWAQAKKTITEALQIATPGDHIWVAEGTYPESIVLTTGVLTYGGFAGTESRVSERDFVAHPTIIDASTASHVVVMDGITESRIDGFTLTGGKARGSNFREGSGGGIFCYQANHTNVIANCTITRNSAEVRGGGGLYLTRSAPRIEDCTIRHNVSFQSGGGLECSQSAPVIRNCAFIGNVAKGWTGGGLSSWFSNPRIIGCVVSGNRAGSGGGIGSSSMDGTVEITSCTISGNSAGIGGGVYCGWSVRMTNSVISGNSAGEGAGVFLFQYSGPVQITNCTFSGNAPTSSGAVYGYRGAQQSITNSIFEGNEGGAVHLENPGATMTAAYCLFHNNPDGDYFDGATTHTGAAAINANVVSAHDNVDGDPLFTMGATGTWTEPPRFDPLTSQTTLIDAEASFAPGSLVGRLINPNTAQRFQTFITSNTATAIEVVGDLRAVATSGATYLIIDYHLGAGSAAIDRGTGAGAPALDIEGTPRPIDVPGVGADGTASEYDIGAYEFWIPPDFRATLLNVEPSPIICGRPVALAGSVANQTNVACDQPVWVEFLAIALQSDWRGYLCDSILLPRVGARENIDLAALDPPRVAYTDIPVGVYAVVMYVDPLQAVAEWDESNNTSRWEPVVILPDRPNLAVGGFDFSPQDVATTGGDTLQLSFEIQNTGSRPTTGGFWVEFRVSPQLPFNPAGPYLCDSLGVAQPLAAGETLRLAPLSRATYALPPGVYFVGIRLDPLDEVAEQNEDDNVTWQPRKKLYVGPRPTRATSWLYYR